MRPIAMAAQQTQIDVLVLGGGPAGAATAGLLAQRGHVVWLGDDGREHPAAPVETLLPAALSAIDGGGGDAWSCGEVIHPPPTLPLLSRCCIVLCWRSARRSTCT